VTTKQEQLAGEHTVKISLDSSITRNYEAASSREWLETNGLGGWASSTVAGAHTRRYHGLLVAATKPPVGRMVLLSRLEETVHTDEGSYALSANRFPGVVHPRGFEYLHSFERDLFPVFEFRVGDIRLRKTIAAVNGENTTLVLYEVLASPSPFTLALQPFSAPRDYHSMSHANDAIRREGTFTDGTFRVQSYEGVPELFLSVPGASFVPDPAWYYNFEYDREQHRGLDFREDLFTYGVFTRVLRQGDRFGVIISTSPPDARDAFDLFERERDRRRGLAVALPVRDDFSRLLSLAADQFIVRRGENLRTLIAGYHWFSDWGRDTMIALPGICLVTGRFEEARRILRAFAQSVDRGMLPNRFPDAGEHPEYNTIDATLWFFIAIYRYLLYTGDDAFVRDELLPILLDIISWHDRGTRYRIRVDGHGLLSGGESGVQLTWMDAKVGDWVVTPRQGLAVEINALWYNALVICATILDRYGRRNEAGAYRLRADDVRDQFGRVFWNPATQCLYDTVDGDRADDSLRPNQIFALCLPFPLITGERARLVLQLVEEKLYTPFGLRSLSPDDRNYRPQYGGDQWSRDSAYHQGTVWSWLLGPFADAVVAVEGEEGRGRARQILEGIIPHLAESGIGSISEIFDADSPREGRGCIAQAWSIGEVLRSYVETAHGVLPRGARDHTSTVVLHS
jgi:predicted glycogen debranching enzyme